MTNSNPSGAYLAVINRRSAYLRKKDLQQELGVSRGTVDRLFSGVQDGIKSGRYGRYCVAGSFINFYAVIDYLKYGDMLKDKNMKKYVPAFSPDEVAETCGYNMRRWKTNDECIISFDHDGHRVPDGCGRHG